MTGDLLRPEGSRAWTQVSRGRAHALRKIDGYEVEFLPFLGGKAWAPLRATTEHHPHMRYRARKVSSA